MSFGGFGGGDLSQRAQIMLSLRSEGTGELAAVRAELDSLKSQAAGLEAIYKSGAIGLRDYLTTMKDYERQIAALMGVEKALSSTERGAIETANEYLKTVTLTTEAVQADVIARRQQQSVIAGAARERQHLNDVLREGAEMEATATRAVMPQTIAAHKVLQQTIATTAADVNGYTIGQEQASQRANRFGYAILNVSHAFQDLQYGVGAVLNNIPLIVTSMGGGPGLAGTIMALAVAADVARTHVGDLGAALGLSDDPAKALGRTIGELADKVKAIEEKKVKFAFDYAELDEAKRRWKELEKLKALVEGTKETTPEKELSDMIQKAVREGGGSGRLLKAVAEGEAVSGVEHGAQTDINIVANTNRLIATLQKRREGEGAFAGAATDMLIWDMTRRRDAAQRKIEEARAGYAESEVGKFEAGDPGAIKRMRNRARDMPGAFDKDFLLDLGKMPGSPAEMKGRMDQREEVDAIIDEMEEESKKATKKANKVRQEADARVRAQEKADEDARRIGEQGAAKVARARDQEVARQASLFGGRLGQDGDLPMAILGRMKGGRNPVQGLAGQVRGLLDDVPPEIAGDVAEKIVRDMEEKVRAEVAAAGGGRGGVDAAIAARRGKMDRAMDAAAGHDARAAAGQQEAMMAQQIASTFGGMPEDQDVVAAAHVAMNKIKQGVAEQRAMFAAVRQVLGGVADAQQEAIEMQAMMMGQMGMVRAQVGRGRARRRPLMPAFPQF